MPKPHCMFLTSTTTFHITTKPSLCLNIDEAATLFRIPDLHPVIRDFLQHLQDNASYPITSIRNKDPQYPLLLNHIQISCKLHVQQPLYHSKGKVDSPQALRAFHPSNTHPHRLYDTAIMSPDSESNWPLWGIKGIITASTLCATCWLVNGRPLCHPASTHLPPPKH